MMNQTKLAGFKAEASLGKASHHYHYAIAGVATAEIGVLPSSILPSQFDGLEEAASGDEGDEMGEDSGEDMEEEE